MYLRLRFFRAAFFALGIVALTACGSTYTSPATPGSPAGSQSRASVGSVDPHGACPATADSVFAACGCPPEIEGLVNANSQLTITERDRTAYQQCVTVNADITGGGMSIAKGNVDACLKNNGVVHEPTRNAMLRVFEQAATIHADRARAWNQCYERVLRTGVGKTSAPTTPMCAGCTMNDDACMQRTFSRLPGLAECKQPGPETAEMCARASGNNASAAAGYSDMAKHFLLQREQARISCESRNEGLDACPDYAAANAQVVAIATQCEKYYNERAGGMK